MNPEYRSRLVAQEIKRDKREDLFAATPPIEAKKILLAFAVTQGVGYQQDRQQGMRIDFIDVRRAFFHAAARRAVYAQLPPGGKDIGKRGRLNKAMYGNKVCSPELGVCVPRVRGGDWLHNGTLDAVHLQA